MDGFFNVRDGAESPAVVDECSGGFELVFGGAGGCHDLDEGEEESAVVVGGPLGGHDGWVGLG